MKKEDVYKKTLPTNTKIPSAKTLILKLFSEKGEKAIYKTQADIVKALDERFPHYRKQRVEERGTEHISVCQQAAVSKALKKIKNQIHELDNGPFRIMKINGEYVYTPIGDIDYQAAELAKTQSIKELYKLNPFENDVSLEISEKMYAYEIKKEAKKRTAELLMDIYEDYIFDIFHHSNKMYVVTNKYANKKIQKELTELPAMVNSYVHNKQWYNRKKSSDIEKDS